MAGLGINLRLQLYDALGVGMAVCAKARDGSGKVLIHGIHVIALYRKMQCGKAFATFTRCPIGNK